MTNYTSNTKAELIAILKQRGVRGYSSKTKAQLIDMAVASEPKPKPKKFKIEIEKEPSEQLSNKDKPYGYLIERYGDTSLLRKLLSLVDTAIMYARGGKSGKFLTDFFNDKIIPAINLFGAEYLPYGGAQELLDEFYYDMVEEFQKHPTSTNYDKPAPSKPKYKIKIG
jgi:hypothetical protein